MSLSSVSLQIWKEELVMQLPDSKRKSSGDHCNLCINRSRRIKVEARGGKWLASSGSTLGGCSGSKSGRAGTIATSQGNCAGCALLSSSQVYPLPFISPSTTQLTKRRNASASVNSQLWSCRRNPFCLCFCLCFCFRPCFCF